MSNKDNPQAKMAPEAEVSPGAKAPRDATNASQAQTPGAKGAEGGQSADSPEWADSLRNMYDSVVDEPIPDSFKDLLAQFDEPDTGNDGGSAGGGKQ